MIRSPTIPGNQLPDGILHRERLLHALTTHPIVWIAGPAGAGKTTLVATYLQQHDRPALWYQLDDSDRLPANLFHHLKQAAEQAFGDSATCLPSPENLADPAGPARDFFTRLCQILGQNGILVLDDCHHLPPETPELIIWALTVRPGKIQVILVGRHEPPAALARLQLYGHIARLDWSDLRLTPGETLKLARLRHSPLEEEEAIKRLHQETDGWVAGLVLLLDHPERGAAEANCQLLFDYFATETLAALSPAERHFLLRTALLPVIQISAAERLTGYGGAEALLEELCRRNLFTCRHTGPVPGYVYHPLLRQFLLARLETELSSSDLATLQRYATELLAESGQLEAAIALQTEKRALPPPPDPTAESRPWPVKIYTLGRFTLVCHGRPLHFSGKAPKRPLDLLKVLIALGGCGIAITRITDILWPEAEGDHGHEALKVTLKRLRRLLPVTQVVELSAGQLALNPELCWVDIWAFERGLGQHEDDGSLEKTLALYHAPFLAQEAEDPAWALATRQRLQHKFLQATLTLGHRRETAGHWHRAIAGYQHALEAEPLCEVLYQRLMHCHLALGQHAEGVRIYQQCREILANHLNIAPSTETETLYRQLCA